MNLVKGVDFITISSRDFDRSIEFYGTTLGLPEGKRYGKMPGVEFETGTVTLAILQSDAFGIEFRAHNHPIAFHVDDVEAARAELEAKGIEFAAETMDSGVCYMAHFKDPDGNALMLHHRYAPPGARPPAAS